MSSLVDAPRIKRASAAMNQILGRLDPREAMLVLQAAVASTIVHSWERQQWEEVVREHHKQVEMTTRKLGEIIEQKRRPQ